MIASLNEIEATVWKAARGAGLAWGLAEELAQAARWLADHGLDWAEPVVDCLDLAERSGGRLAPPVLEGETWLPAPGSDALSPILCGPLISDLGLQLGAGQELTFGRMAQPLLLLPFAARVARDLGIAVQLGWNGTQFTCQGSKLYGSRDRDSSRKIAERIVLTRSLNAAGKSQPELPAGAPRRSVAAQPTERLEAWVRRTYVAASAESRLVGAGAGLTDND